jgi:type I restriction enzyme S subunit
MKKRASDRQRIAVILEQRFPNNQIAPAHFEELLGEYAESGLGPPHLITEIETGDEGKLWSCIWEAMLYRHLRLQGYNPKGTANSTGQHGPDFLVDDAGKAIWIEAVAPAPSGIPADYLEAPQPNGEIRVKKKPDIERVLRCTSTIADKRRQLAAYQAAGLIGATDCTVIAVNICRLSDWDFEGTGISQKPLSLEAVFPIGPLVANMTPDGKIDGPAENMPRFTVPKTSGQKIATTAFLEPSFANVSAVIQAHQKDMYERGLALAIIHNPLASAPLPRGLFGAQKEFIAQADGDVFQLHDIRFEARLQKLRDSLERRFHAHEDHAVRLLTEAEAGDFVGERGKCHKNVNRWCFSRDHFQHLQVRGWLISGNCVLDKHSVVDMGDGELVDVTPMPDSNRRTFLRHDGTEDEFRAMPNQIILSR